MQNKEPVLVKKSNKIISYLALLMITGCSNTIKNHDPILVNAFQDQYVDYILVPVTINGEKYTFLLDTGSSTSVIDQSLVNKLTSNLDAPPAFYQKYFNVVKTVSDNKKMADVNFVNPISFYIGEKYFNGGDFWAANDLSLLSQMVGENISGILGIDIFRRLNWEIDNKNKVLTLYDNPPNINNYEQCITYDDYTLGAPSFNAYFDDKTYVNVKLDTGSKVSYLSSEFLDYLKENKINKMEKIEQFDNAITIDFSGVNNKKEDLYRIQQVQLNDTTLIDQKFAENNNNAYAIGMSALASFDKYLLSPDRMLICYNSHKSPEKELQDIRKINIRMFNNNIEFFYNNEDTLAKYPIQNGDVLMSLNGVSYPTKALVKVQHLINTLPKGQLSLVLRRQGTLIKVDF
ncbi:retropepsin-like aspartic protease [Providencia vermicola]|nr:MULTISPECIES: retropepsin-like aspartic protease [Providencia]ELR5121998.1 clan AA aspartic protease [Providencia stuartii]ELR5123467.1 clan AA aspartic protease [Providencia stuartii]ELR5140736.1 clan AA aspartic protease [Providencia stuartii]MTB41069.1 hypothetical protein [Providencia sp. wls1949]WBA58011.1 retropepsin-like aspartic protease [Providencia sp. 21OH12SH02B-Prov]